MRALWSSQSPGGTQREAWGRWVGLSLRNTGEMAEKRNGMVLQEDTSMSRGLRVRENLILLEVQTRRVKEREVLPKKMASALLQWTWPYSHREGKHSCP